MVLNIIDNINDMANTLKKFFINNQTNPILWIALFLGGLIIAMITYDYLNKRN